MSRFRPRTAAAVIVAPVLAGLAACSSSGEPTALPSGPTLASTAAPSTVAPATASPTPAPTVGTRRSPIRWLGPAAPASQAAVQEATRSYWSMVVRLAEKPDPADPDIAALSVSPQRDQLMTLFTNTRKQGIAQRGPIDGSVTVAAVTGSRATASTCLDQTLVRLYDAAGKLRPGSSGSVQRFAVSLKQDEGSWKVSQVETENDPCTLPR